MTRRKPKPKGMCEVVVNDAAMFDPASLRYVKNGDATVLVGCPKGKYKNGACSVATRAHKVLSKAKNGRCEVGRKAKEP